MYCFGSCFGMQTVVRSLTRLDEIAPVAVVTVPIQWTALVRQAVVNSLIVIWLAVIHLAAIGLAIGKTGRAGTGCN